MLGHLGEGGMGIVWKARHIALNRIVALKFLRDGGLGPEERLRFRTEAAAIARLQHPHIVQVYEVGEAEGRAFLALEYLPGGSLAQRLATAPLEARAAAALVATLAEAMAAAHAQGVIHRDLKPGNILLDPHGAPKIGDFGLAKLLDMDRGPETKLDAAPTRTGAILGTPSYMAPEQASGSKTVGTAADVYALGAILYECLTGRPPFRAASPLETLEQVRSQDPVPPRRLQPRTPRDLETICLRCLHKDPARRFPAATALADDLRRFLQGQPIRSRPVGIGERAWKLVRRRPALVGLALFSGVAAIALVVGGLIYQVRLRNAVETARSQQARAEDHYEKMLHAVDVLLGEVGDQRLEAVPEMEEARARLLDEALRFYRELTSGKESADPALRRETGRALCRTSRIQLVLGEVDRAETDGREAVALLGQLCDEFPDDDRYRQDLATAHGILARVYEVLDRPAEAVAQSRQAIAIWEALLPHHPELSWALALSCAEHGARLRDDPAAARESFRRALDLTEEDLRLRPGDEAALGRLGAAYLNLGIVEQTSGNPDAAENAYRQAVAAWETVTARARRLGPTHRSLASAYNDLAALLVERNRWKTGEEIHKKALELRKQLHRRHPQVASSTSELCDTWENLAKLYLLTGRNDLARQALLEAVAVREPLVRECPRVGHYAERLNRDYQNLARIEGDAHRLEEAMSWCRKALAVAEALVQEAPENPSYQCILGGTLFQLGHRLGEARMHDEGVACCTRAIRTLEPLLKQNPGHGEARLMLRGAYAARAQIYNETGQVFWMLSDFSRLKMLEVPAPPEKNKPSRK
jgi:tetratricopeptide (TPR) repeat protein